jgi:hypothetical protein
VSGHVGLSKSSFTYWEVYSISNASSLVLSDSVIDSTVPSVSWQGDVAPVMGTFYNRVSTNVLKFMQAFVHVSDSSSATVNGLRILGEASDTMDEPVYGIFIDAKSTTTLDNVCFDGGEYTYPVWSQGGKFLYSNVSAMDESIEATNNDNCRAMFVNGECIDFDSTSCGSNGVTLAPATMTAPQAAPSMDSSSSSPNAVRSMWFWSSFAGLLSTFGAFLL